MSPSKVMRDTGQVFWREMKRFWRQKARIVVTVVQPVLWLVFMGSLMNEATGRIPRVSLVLGAPDYLSYMTPGAIIITTLFSGVYTGISLLWDRRTGFLNRLLASSISRAAIPAGKIAATMAQNTMQVAVLAGAAALLGVRFATGLPGLLMCLVVTAIVSVIVGGFSLALAARIRTPEVLVSIISCVALPLVCASTVILPTLFMPGWLATVSAWNPLTFAVKPLRDLVNKGWFWDDLAADAACVLAAAGIMFAVVVRQFRRSEA